MDTLPEERSHSFASVVWEGSSEDSLESGSQAIQEVAIEHTDPPLDENASNSEGSVLSGFQAHEEEVFNTTPQLDESDNTSEGSMLPGSQDLEEVDGARREWMLPVVPNPPLDDEEIDEAMELSLSYAPQRHVVKINGFSVMILVKICIKYGLSAEKRTRYFEGVLERSDDYIFRKLQLEPSRANWQHILNSMKYKWPKGTPNTTENVTESLRLRCYMLLGYDANKFDYLYNYVDI